MPQTQTQKILARAAGRAEVRANEFILARLSLVLGNDITSPVAIDRFPAFGRAKVFDPARIALVCDHFTPSRDIRAATQCARIRSFARAQGIARFHEPGAGGGIEHALLPERGLVTAGDCIVGADSHTCTYGALGAFATGVGSTDMAFGMATGQAWFRVPEAIRVRLAGTPPPNVSGKDVILRLIGEIGVDGARYQSLEFQGDGVAALSMDDRFTIANMAVEAGAKNGIFPVSAATKAYLADHGAKPPAVFEADPDAEYAREIDIDLAALRPLVACPHSPANVRPAAELGGIAIDQAVIGSCTNGRLGDLRAAAAVLRGKKVAPGVRALVFPATQRIWLAAAREGLLADFAEAGCVVCEPTCGPCLGAHTGVLAAGERAIATTNRNFVGRMGHTESEVYLASPATAAASAVAGRIVPPPSPV
jgi:3-isopropylmalate/(R)-2-methylmalate dehydratase large subunit